MKSLIFLFVTVLWNTRQAQGCTPTMYQQTFSKNALTIPVESLTIGPTYGITSHWLITETHQNDHSYVCTQNEDGFEIDRFKDTLNSIPKLNYLDIKGISSIFKPKVKCNRGHKIVTGPQEYTFYYLGQYKGTWQLQTKYSLQDPHFYLYIEQHTYAPKGHQQWYIGATGKYYPCQEEALGPENARAAASSQGTRIDVLKNVQFQPSWIHKYMSKSGEWDGANKVTQDIEKIAKMPTDKYHYTVLVNEKDDDTKSLVLVSNNPTTIGETEKIPTTSSFEIGEVYWTGKLVADSNSWRKLVDYGFSGFTKHFAISSKLADFKDPIVKSVESLSTLTMSVLHGDKRGPLYHDHTEKYQIKVEGGQFSSDDKKMKSGLLRGLKFNFESYGHWLRKSSLNIETTTCHDSNGQLKSRLKSLWQAMRRATSSKDYIKETKTAVSAQTPKCSANTFRLLGISAEASQEFPGYAHITLSWMDNKDSRDIRYDCTAYLKSEKFLKFIQEDYFEEEEIFS
ncbi:uncharacterized protein [Clytia hemisphaerica]|uniref:uncharacterized protein n=1 Tax=Clytia hemisphaerica TaxID=252671 RepID=UPI0034D54C1F